MGFNIKIFLAALVLIFIFSACSSNMNSRVLNVYNWGEYIDPEILDEFQQKTGIKVNYDEFPSNEDMYAKVKNSSSGYDIVFPSDYMLERMIKEDLVQKINFDNIPNFKNIHTRFINLSFDPTSEYSMPYMWGTLGIMYNKSLVNKPVNSWDILWDEDYAGQIFIYDSMRDAFCMALKKLGYPINITDVNKLNEAKDQLILQKPLVQAYAGDSIRDKMINESAALALTYSGDAFLCSLENSDIDYVIPDEGSNVWVDVIAILKGAQNITEAEEFINFLCDPEVALRNTEYIGYSTTNQVAYDLLDDDVKNNHIYWTSDDDFGRTEFFFYSQDMIREYDNAWTEVLS